MKTKNRRHGFTLLETLVVMAILSLLFGIVYAAMGGVRERGRQTVCVSNLHQLGTAFHMYLADYDAEDNPKLIGTMDVSGDPLKSYGAGIRALRCPDRPAGSAPSDYKDGIWSDPPPTPYLPSFSKVFQQCGPQTMIFADDNHNFPDPNLPPSGPWFLMLCRYDGSVSRGYYNTRYSINWVNPCYVKEGQQP